LARFYEDMAEINEMDTKTHIEHCLFMIVDIMLRKIEEGEEKVKAQKKQG